MLLRVLALTVLAFVSVFVRAEEPPPDPGLKKRLVAYLKANHLSPEEYVIRKFKDHDVVFIGEWHRIKHDPELIQALIPQLYKNGVFILAIEFARREDQDLIDRLVSAPTYDEALARRLQFSHFVFWGYQEYVDIYKAAWRLNRGLREDQRKFRVLGLSDSPDWSVLKTEEDTRNPELRRKVWRGGGEQFWAKVILDEVAKKEKVLVYSGIHHAFSEYQQPIYDEQQKKFVRFETERMGNYVYRQIAKRAITIFLHAPWVNAEGYGRPAVQPADGIMDAVMAEAGPRFRRAGFDTKGTLFADLPSNTALYKYGYEKFTLGMYCDGYIFQKPFAEYAGVTPIPDFINEGNIEQARAQSPNVRLRSASIEVFNAGIAEDANVKKRLAALR